MCAYFYTCVHSFVQKLHETSPVPKKRVREKNKNINEPMAAAYCEDVFNALRMIEKALEIEVEKEAILRPQQEGTPWWL